MYGLEAINANNGWAMAAVGSTIVFIGLAVLSFAISQIHKILAFTESKQPANTEEPSMAADEYDALFAVPDTFSNDPTEIALYYQPLTDQLGEPFQLVELYRICGKHGFPHAHLSIRRLRDAGILAPEGNGFFRWMNP